MEWISVKERLPESKEQVLCYTRGWCRQIQNSWEEYTDQDADWFRKSFSHWAALPEPPINPTSTN